MKKLLLIVMLAGMAMAYAGCKKDSNVNPSKAPAYQLSPTPKASGDSSGGENDPTPPSH
jgi:hypothetical protein